MNMFRKIYNTQREESCAGCSRFDWFQGLAFERGNQVVVETLCGLLNSKGKIETVALECLFVTNIKNH